MPPYHGSLHLPKDTIDGRYNGGSGIEAAEATVQPSRVELEQLADLHHQTTQHSHTGPEEKNGARAEFRDYIRESTLGNKCYPKHRGVCFDSLSVYGSSVSGHSAKTLGTALWRTLTFQDILEQILPSSLRLQKCRPKAIISDFSGVVRSGQMML
jgi:hypothetical protein